MINGDELGRDYRPLPMSLDPRRLRTPSRGNSSTTPARMT